MINAFAVMEGIYSTEIERGPYTPDERKAMLIYLLGVEAGDKNMTMKLAMEIVRRMNEAPTES